MSPAFAVLGSRCINTTTTTNTTLTSTSFTIYVYIYILPSCKDVEAQCRDLPGGGGRRARRCCKPGDGCREPCQHGPCDGFQTLFFSFRSCYDMFKPVIHGHFHACTASLPKVYAGSRLRRKVVAPWLRLFSHDTGLYRVIWY